MFKIYINYFLFLLFAICSTLIGIPSGIIFLLLLLILIYERSNNLLLIFNDKLFIGILASFFIGYLNSLLYAGFRLDQLLRFIQHLTGVFLGWMTACKYKNQSDLKHRYIWICFIFLMVMQIVAKYLLLEINLQILRIFTAFFAVLIVIDTMKKGKSALVITFILMAALLAAYKSKTQALLPMIAYLIMQFTKTKKITFFSSMKFSAAIVILLLGILGMFYVVMPSRFNDIFSWEQSVSTLARLSLFSASVLALLERPWLGHGPIGFNSPELFKKHYQDSELLQNLINEGLTRSHAYSGVGASYSPGTHFMYTDILVSYGIISGIFLILMIYKSFIYLKFIQSPIPIAALITIIFSGLSWQYSSTEYGMGMLIFAFVALRQEHMRIKSLSHANG
ncbi:MAG: O-antigen ligase family protein [Pseudomonadota bacterium]